MTKATLVMEAEAMEIFESIDTADKFTDKDFFKEVSIKNELYSIFGWNDLDDIDIEDLREVFLEMTGLDIQYLYIFNQENSTSLGGHEFRDVWNWYKDVEDMFSSKAEKIVVLRDIDDGSILAGVVVDKSSNPMDVIKRAVNNYEDWNIEDILSEWGEHENINILDVEDFLI